MNLLVIGKSPPLLGQPIWATFVVIVEKRNELAVSFGQYSVSDGGYTLIGLAADDSKSRFMPSQFLDQGS
jgi:hypothetical protein